MTSLRVKALLLIFSTVFTVGAASAQEQTPGDGQKDVRGIAFTAIALSSLPFENIYYRNGKEFIGIEWRNGRRSQPYSLAKAKALEVFTDSDDPENPYRLIGKASLVSGTRKMLYFFGENGAKKEGALPVSLFGIDDSETTFPESSYRFINFISVPLVIDFNKKRFLVNPGKPTVKKLTLPEAGEFTPFVVRNSKGVVLGGTRLFSHAANREMVLIFPPKKGKKRLDIRYFSD